MSGQVAAQIPKRNLAAILEQVTGAKAAARAATVEVAHPAEVADPPPHVEPRNMPSALRTQQRVKTVNYVLEALEDLGGKAFLVKLGRSNPEKFADMLMKTMPTKLEVEDSSGLMQLLAEQTMRARALQIAQAKREMQAANKAEDARVVDTQ